MQKMKDGPRTLVLNATKVFIALLAIMIGLYPIFYFVSGSSFGLLARKDPSLSKALLYNTAFYIHITGGGLALLSGWPQFIEKLRLAKVRLHRNLGKLYVLSALSSAATGIAIGLFADGGYVAQTGFISLGIVWFLTTLTAYTAIRKKDIRSHRVMMVYSYAACLAAVTLRVYTPLLNAFFHDATTAYRVVAWLCWTPNMLIAYLSLLPAKTKCDDGKA